MAERLERASFLPTSERNRPVQNTEHKKMQERQSISYARTNTAAVLSFRTKLTPMEPEDARITGATRSLYRRLLALNLRKPVTVASMRETEAYLPPLTA
jgi:hypothetical protein